MIRFWVFGAIGFAGVAAIGIFAWFVLSPLDRRPGDPVSLLQPDGVTVIEKRVQPVEGGQEAVAAPVADGAGRASGYAMDLGGATSFAELSRRFGGIAGANEEAGLDELEARATLKDTLAGLEARLLVGPFPTEQAAREACASIALPAEIACRAAPFEGELIERE